MNIEAAKKPSPAITILKKTVYCVLAVLFTIIPSFMIHLALMDPRYLFVIRCGSILLLPSLPIVLILAKNRKKAALRWVLGLAVFLLITGGNTAWILYDESITVNTAPSINTYDYLPFQEDSGIARLKEPASLQLSGELPVVDGAAAVFPVYSAFVNATYPNTTELYDGYFEYNNTRGGYDALAERNSDIFFGAYPSQEQIDYAREQGTEFVCTPIGMEGFVFFVHKDNPVDNLTKEQVQKIYTGEITNWKQVGGKNEPIAAYQRNNGSGSQSMFLRFMEDNIPMEATTETKVGGMLDIIETVADYRSKEGSIGFSFRFYVEGLIRNPDIKMLSIDGVAPTVESIQNGTYPITTALYAVTWEGNEKENVQLLLDWVLSEEGQYIIEKTGYVPIR